MSKRRQAVAFNAALNAELVRLKCQQGPPPLLYADDDSHRYADLGNIQKAKPLFPNNKEQEGNGPLSFRT